MKPVSITIAVQPEALSTPATLRNLGQRHFGGCGWQTVARKIAKRAGGHIVLLANGSIRIFTLRGEKVTQETYPDGKWSFAR